MSSLGPSAHHRLRKPGILRFHFRKTGAARSNGFLKSSYAITCNGEEAVAGWDPRDTKAVETLTDILEIFSQGRLAPKGLGWLARVLHRWLNGKKGALENKITEALNDGIAGIELTADRDSISLLTNIPWEVTSIGSGDALKSSQPKIADLFAKFPVVRMIRGKNIAAIPEERLRAYYCISNPHHPDVTRFNATEFRKKLRVIFRQFPMIDVKPSELDMDDPVAELVLQDIRDFRPHVFVFVGHGDSKHKKHTQPELLFEDWIQFSRIARPLVATGNTLIALLICCDMTRRNETIGGWSGAHKLAQEGVPSIVAMQGDISPRFAAVFLQQLLVNVLRGISVSEAVSRSRDTSRRSGPSPIQAFLPAVFVDERAPADLVRTTLRNYRNALAELSRAISEPTVYLERPTIERRIAQLLDASGLRIIDGTYGCGKTTLLATVIRRRIAGEEVPVRPMFYLSCDQPEYSDSSQDYLFSQIGAVLKEYSALLSKTSPLDNENDLLSETEPGRFFTMLNRRRVIVVLDNFSFPKSRKIRDSWATVLKAAASMQESLLILAASVPNEILTDMGEPAIKIEPFSEQETESYLRKFVPSYAREAKTQNRLAMKIHRWDGGLPQLLNQRRLDAQATGISHPSLLVPGVFMRNMAAAYVRRAQRQLSPDERHFLYRLWWLPRMTSVDLAIEFLDSSKNSNALTALQRAGVVKITSRESVDFCYVPSALSQAIGRLAASHLRPAAQQITTQFWSRLPKRDDDIGNFFKGIARRPGGLALLACVQRAHIARRELRDARDIATSAHYSGLERASVWQLYQSAQGRSRVNDWPFMLRAAELAQGLGRQNEAQSILKKIPVRSLSPYNHVKFLQIRAALLKDVSQHAGVPQIMRIYKEAIPLARKGVAGKLRDTDAYKEDWKDILCVLLHNRLMVRAFLQHESLDAMAADLKELRQLQGNSPGFADELCLMAEYELKAPEGRIDWKRVRDTLLEAKKLLRGTGFDRSLAPCLYFYGKYLQFRPDPQLEEAANAYHKAERTAAKVGDFRQMGRARRRWVDLEWRELGRLKAKGACPLLEEVIRPLERQRGDSLGLRVLGQLCTLRAEIGAHVRDDPIDAYLLLACRAWARPVLQAKTDRERFAHAVARYLESLQRQKRFSTAIEFVYRYKQPIKEKLGINEDSDDPWRVCDLIRKSYPEERRRKKWGRAREEL